MFLNQVDVVDVFKCERYRFSFNLIDELTGEPVRGEGYPIVITTPKEVVPKLLPVMQVGMRAMSLYNGVAGIVRMFGAPAPSVPEAWREGAQSSIELLKQESSVEAFDAVRHRRTADSCEPRHWLRLLHAAIAADGLDFHPLDRCTTR